MEIKITQKLLNHIGEELDCKITNHEILGSGEHNINYILKSNKGKFVLRIYANTQFENADKEFKIMKKLDGRFTARVFYLDTSKEYLEQDYMIQEFIEGKTLINFDRTNIVKVAKLLKEIHKIKDLRKDRFWKNPISYWTKNNLLNNSKFISEEFSLEMKVLYEEVLQRLEEIKPFIKKYKRNSLMHDDPIPANFIEKKNGELILVDWELAGFDYFFFDFGCIIAESRINKELEQIFLEAYGFGINPNEKKVVDAICISRILSLIGWLIERIALSKQGKSSFALQDNDKYEKMLKEELKHIQMLLKK